MAVNEDVIRLILETKGADTIAQLEKSTANYKALLEDLIGSYARGEVTTEEMTKAQRQYASELSRASGLLNELKAEQQAQADAVEAAAQEQVEAAQRVAQAQVDLAAAAKQEAAERSEAAERVASAARRAAQIQVEADERAKGAVYDLADAYELVEQTQTTYVTAARKGSTAQSEAAANAAKYAAGLESLRATVARTTEATTKQAAATTKSSGGMSQLSQQIQAGSFAFQDFTSASGDLGQKLNAISNNLPTLLIGLGGLGQVISTGAVAAIALYRNWDSVTGLFEERNPFPQAAKDVEGLKRELEKAKDELAKMEDAGSGNAAQLAKYNELRGKTATIEKQIAEDMERQAAVEKLRQIDPDKKANEERAKSLQEGVAGQGFNSDDLINSVREAIKSDAHEQRTELVRKIKDMPEGEERAALGMRALNLGNLINDVAERQKQAEELVTKAVNQGQVGPGEQIRALMGRQPEKFIPEQVAAFAKADPDAMKAKADAEQAQRQAEELDAFNKQQGADDLKFLRDRDKTANDARLRQANDAANALERDPTVQAELKRNREKFGDFRNLEGAGGEEARAKAQQIKAQAEGAKGDQRQLNPVAMAAAQQDLAGAMLDITGNLRAVGNEFGALKAMVSEIRKRTAQNERFLQQPGNWNGNPMGGGQ